VVSAHEGSLGIVPAHPFKIRARRYETTGRIILELKLIFFIFSQATRLKISFHNYLNIF